MGGGGIRLNNQQADVMLVLLQNPIVNRLQIPVGHFQARPVRPVRPFLLTRLPSPLPHIWTASSPPSPVWSVANTVTAHRNAVTLAASSDTLQISIYEYMAEGEEGPGGADLLVRSRSSRPRTPKEAPAYDT